MNHLHRPVLVVAAGIAFAIAAGCFSASAAAPGELVSLFDGKTLDGWDYDPALWRVEDAMITGGSTTEKVTHNDFICTKKNYQNFELTLKIKCSGDPATGMINSGIQIRSLRVPGGAHMSGYQVDCGKGWFGKLYDEFRRNRVIAEPLDAAALEKVVDVYGWNEFRIRAEGPRIQVWINGVHAIDYTEQDKNIALDGRIGPQVHSGGACLVQVKDVTIQELPPTPDAPTWESLGGVEAARKLVAPPPKNPKPGAKSATPAPARQGRDISYNDVQGAPRSAAEQLEMFQLPEGYEIELVAQESDGIGKFVSVYFDQRGRMWTQTALEYPVDANENPATAEALYQGEGKDRILVFAREALNAPLPPAGLTDPTIFADGLAIPLGILPWGNGDSCYVLHGHDLLLLTDADGDGQADRREVILTGFGIQDSHLFPHQFTRAPGGWIWMAQGLFNDSEVKLPGGKEVILFPKCSMARMRPDGSAFEVTSTGPNNIWGLVVTGEGEGFIQEANDYGYPVMPFHDYAYYPGGMAGLRRSYQPEFPPTAEFRMGGTGLSGLALLEYGPATDPKADHTMLVANPIISRIQVVAMCRDGPYWNLEQCPDIVTCDDPFFRPVAMTEGPDGSIYVVDWYNKIISHNEVPRNHPDRDKTRGRIWRIRSTAGEDNAAALEIPDFTRLSGDELIAMLGSRPTARAHLAWQTLSDTGDSDIGNQLQAVLGNAKHGDAASIQCLWAMEALKAGDLDDKEIEAICLSTNRNVRREAIRMLGCITSSGSDAEAGCTVERAIALLRDQAERELDSEVRFQVIQEAGVLAEGQTRRGEPLNPEDRLNAFRLLVFLAQPALDGPLGPSSRAAGQIPVREAYDREFERFLIRMFLERHPDALANFLDSGAAGDLPIESRVLAALALEPKAGASRMAALLPQLDRLPNAEELMRLAQYPDEPGCGEALDALLARPGTRARVVSQLLEQRTRLDAAKIAPSLSAAARSMLESGDASLAVDLVGAFQLAALEPDLVTMLESPKRTVDVLPLLRALRQVRSTAVHLFASLATSSDDPQIRDEALAALAESKAPEAPAKLFALYPDLDLAQRRNALNALSATRPGARNVVAALRDGRLPKDDLDGPTAERLSAVLGDDPDLVALMKSLGHVFRDVLVLDGTAAAWTDAGIALDGPFTVETWVRLDPGIHNHDGILGAPGVLDLNFFDSAFRVWVAGLHDVAVSTKPVAPDLWTHVAVTRDAAGGIKIYTNGELDAIGRKEAPGTFAGLKVGWTNPKEGTKGALAEFRVWNRERSASEIRSTFDRSFADAPRPEGLVFYNAGGDASWGALGEGARIAKATDVPPLLTPEQAEALDARLARYLDLGRIGGSAKTGEGLSALCIACHVIGGRGGQIGPDLSGAGAMGLEAVLRNLLTPNAAMEPGYRIFRVELKNGDIIDSFFVSDDKKAVIIRQPGAPDRRIARKDIRSTRYIRRSLMPEGLLDALDDRQVADLLAYLMTLK